MTPKRTIIERTTSPNVTTISPINGTYTRRFTVKIPPVLEVSGLSNDSTYLGNLVVSVTITDNSALSSVKTWITNRVDMISYISQPNLTLINVTDANGTIIAVFDTNFLPNGE